MKKRKTESRTAEAFLYSGRLNPQWRLTPLQMKQWIEQWDDAPHSERQAVRLSVLGYTGCSLQYDEDSYWIIFNGVVSFYKREEVINKKDTERRMERWLLGTGPDEASRQGIDGMNK